MRLGVIGCGQFMSRQHIQTIHRSPGLELHHLADLDRTALDRVAARYAPARTSTDWRAVIQDPQVELVVAGVVPTLHPEIVRASVAAGKPLYVEKPVTATLVEGRELQRLADRHACAVAVGFNRRFAPATALIRQAFASATGPVSIFYRISDDDRVRPPAQNWKKADRLLVEVVHIYDLLHHLVGAEPVQVHAVEARFNDALITMSFADGSRGTILSSSYGSMAQCKERLEAVLDHAAVELDDFVEVRTHGLEDLPERTCFAGRPYDDCDNGHVQAFAERGVEACLALRQRYAAAMERSGVLADSGDAAAWQRFATMSGDPPWPQINYCQDKGWGAALVSFCDAVGRGALPVNAGLADINRATACAEAGRASIVTGKPVRLSPG